MYGMYTKRAANVLPMCCQCVANVLLMKQCQYGMYTKRTKECSECVLYRTSSLSYLQNEFSIERRPDSQQKSAQNVFSTERVLYSMGCTPNEQQWQDTREAIKRSNGVEVLELVGVTHKGNVRVCEAAARALSAIKGV